MITRDFGAFGDSLDPVAPLVGPFAGRAFLEALAFHEPPEEVLLAVSDDGLLPLERRDGVLGFSGHEDLVDYRSPLGRRFSPLFEEVFAAAADGTRFRFDSLPAEAAKSIEEALGELSMPVEILEHSVAVGLRLPSTMDAYLELIGKKQRHELRRKHRRFEETVGSATLKVEPGALGLFFDLHRRSSGEKGAFMTEDRAGLFETLAAQEGWELHVLRSGTDPVAASFGFVDDVGYYLYNSAYDPDRSEASPGIVMLQLLLAESIERGVGWFDFLKGDEVYKFRLGAEPRQLYVIEGTT